MPEPHLEADAVGLRAVLTRIPSRFERLLRVAAMAKSLAENNDDQTPVDSGAHRQVRGDHLAAFEDWLSLSLREKLDDAEICAFGRCCSVAALLLHWTQPSRLPELVPARALTPQRDLFAMELEVLVCRCS